MTQLENPTVQDGEHPQARAQPAKPTVQDGDLPPAQAQPARLAAQAGDLPQRTAQQRIPEQARAHITAPGLPAAIIIAMTKIATIKIESNFKESEK